MSEKFRLRSYDLNPPGGYPYVQTTGIRREFPSVPIIEDQAALVSRFRKGNNLPRSSITESLQDVDCFQCRRLGNMPAFCVPVDQVGAAVAIGQTSPIITPCQGCGVKVS